MNENKIPLPLLIAEARSRAESILTCGLPATVAEIILKEAWLRASVAANDEVNAAYKEFAEQQKKETQEEAE